MYIRCQYILWRYPGVDLETDTWRRGFEEPLPTEMLGPRTETGAQLATVAAKASTLEEGAWGRNRVKVSLPLARPQNNASPHITRGMCRSD